MGEEFRLLLDIGRVPDGSHEGRDVLAQGVVFESGVTTRLEHAPDGECGAEPSSIPPLLFLPDLCKNPVGAPLIKGLPPLPPLTVDLVSDRLDRIGPPL